MMTERDEGLARAGARLRKWRAAQPGALSQAAAAARIKASQSAWAAWERGDKGPDVRSAFKIEKLTRGRVPAAIWAFARRGSLAAAESGEHATSTVSDTG